MRRAMRVSVGPRAMGVALRIYIQMLVGVRVCGGWVRARPNPPRAPPARARGAAPSAAPLPASQAGLLALPPGRRERAIASTFAGSAAHAHTFACK